MYSENIVRRIPCYQCIHCGECKKVDRYTTKRKCLLTGRWGRMDKAYYCNKFKHKQKESSTEEYNGYRVKKDQIEDYRTENQWIEDGFQIKEGVAGHRMYATRIAARNQGKTFVYYLPEEVEPLKNEKVQECCGSCSVREGRYCMVAGDYVRMNGHCSEWSE